MKRLHRVALTASACLLLTLQLPAMDALARLNMAPAAAQEKLLMALVTGNVPFYLATKTMKTLPPAERIDLVRSLIAWAKIETRAPGFAKAYEAWRLTNRPTSTPAASADEQMKKQRDEAKRQMAESWKNLEKLPPDLRKQMEATLKQVEAQQKELENNKEMQGYMKQSLELQGKQAQADYERHLREFDAKFQADPRRLVALRLQEFLDLSAAVDFTARLIDREKQKMFSDPTYERKPLAWKLFFRAGKELVLAARTDAQAWLIEIGGH
jgi:hypothetical protein